MTGPVLPAEPDGLLAQRLATGDRAAVRTLLARHHAVAELLAAAAAAPPGPGDTVRAAWLALRAMSAAGHAPADVRAALLGKVIDILADADLLDQAPTGPAPAPGPFLAGDDRWAGWWADAGPAPWPAGTDPDRRSVIRALRAVPLGPRVLLVLRDAAGLAPDTVAGIIGQAPGWQTVTLHEARDVFAARLSQAVPA